MTKVMVKFYCGCFEIVKQFFLQFEKPGRRSDFDYPEMVAEAVTNALNDGKVHFQDVKQAVVGYVDG